MTRRTTTALIVGAGPGLSAALARRLAARGHRVVIAARDAAKLSDLANEIDAVPVACNARDPASVAALFERIDALDGSLEIAVYNAAHRIQGSITDLDAEGVEAALMVTAYGAFLMAQQAGRRMLPAGQGTMLFTGASAGVKGFPGSAAFAMGKFALRGLCQSLARELHPQGVHIGHVVIDGGIAGTPQSGRFNAQDGADAMLDPDEIARSYMALIDQHRSAWSWELELRPWVETF